MKKIRTVDRAPIRRENHYKRIASLSTGCSEVSVFGQLVNWCDYIDSVGSTSQAHPRTPRDTVQRPGRHNMVGHCMEGRTLGECLLKRHPANNVQRMVQQKTPRDSVQRPGRHNMGRHFMYRGWALGSKRHPANNVQRVVQQKTPRDTVQRPGRHNMGGHCMQGRTLGECLLKIHPADNVQRMVQQRTPN